MRSMERGIMRFEIILTVIGYSLIFSGNWMVGLGILLIHGVNAIAVSEAMKRMNFEIERLKRLKQDIQEKPVQEPCPFL